MVPYSYPKWVRALEIGAILAYAAYFCLFAFRIRGGALGTHPSAWFGLISVLAYLAADFVSGLVHCLADNFGSPTTPVFGPALVRPFREHHADPEGITRHDIIETNGNSCLVSLLVLIPLYHLAPAQPSLWYSAAQAYFTVFTFFIVMTNQIHKWAHSRQPPAFVQWLQRRRLILSPAMHQVHHTAPFDRYYSITNGWTNPILEKARFFETLVRTFKTCPAIEPIPQRKAS